MPLAASSVLTTHPTYPRMARLASVREFLFDELDDPAALMCGEANFSAAAVARSRGRKAFANASACRGLGAVFIILRTNSSFRRCTRS